MVDVYNITCILREYHLETINKEFMLVGWLDFMAYQPL